MTAETSAPRLSADCRERIRAERRHYPEPRAALLGALHLAQSDVGYLPRPVADEVAQLLDLEPIQVQEVIAFYPLFRPRPVGRCHIQVCTNIACALAGARDLMRQIESTLGIRSGESTADGRFSLAQVECLGSCGTAPVVQVNDRPYIENATRAEVAALLDGAATATFEGAKTHVETPAGVDGYLLPPSGESHLDLAAYETHEGYTAARRAWRELVPEQIVEEVKAAGLRGRGGAGFVTGVKWGFMPAESKKPCYLAVNADESEPGTFKDRQILERNPHLLLEGILIAGRAIRAEAAYIYLRGEYATAHRTLLDAITEAYERGLLGDDALGSGRRFDIHVQRGAGAYICGEETGMLESMEGKKGQPRKRPPYPAGYGLWGCPTTVNNVETLAQVPALLRRGAAWFRGIGVEKSTGNTLFGISGHVRRPGVYELPLGTPLRDIVERYAGGAANGRPIKAIIPGGVSMPVLSAEQLDVSMDHESLKQVGSLLGTGGIVVLDESACMVRAAAVAARFFRHESCGQCTQCREGTGFLYKLLARIDRGEGTMDDLDTIRSVSGFMEGQTICALSDAAAWAAGGFLKRFPADFESHVRSGRCPCPDSFEI